MGVSPGGMNDVVCLGLQEDRPSVLSERLPHVLGFCTESGAPKRPGLAQGHPMASWQPGWAHARSPGSTQAPPSLQTQICWSGGEGGAALQLGPSPGTEGPFFVTQQSPCLPCARLQPPSSPADEENLVPASTNMCAFWREGAVRLSSRVGGLKGPEGSHRMGAEQATGCFL